MRSLLVFFILIGVCCTIDAQKLGFINYGNLLENLPQIKDSDQALTNYQDSLSADLERRVIAHKARITENQNKFKAGEMTKVDADAMNIALNQEQATLSEDQRKAEATILVRRQQMFQPIIQKVNDTIDRYAKENGYSFIFDESSGFLLFDQPANDLTEVISNLLVE